MIELNQSFVVPEGVLVLSLSFGLTLAWDEGSVGVGVSLTSVDDLTSVAGDPVGVKKLFNRGSEVRIFFKQARDDLSDRRVRDFLEIDLRI